MAAQLNDKEKGLLEALGVNPDVVDKKKGSSGSKKGVFSTKKKQSNLDEYVPLAFFSVVLCACIPPAPGQTIPAARLYIHCCLCNIFSFAIYYSGILLPVAVLFVYLVSLCVYD